MKDNCTYGRKENRIFVILDIFMYTTIIVTHFLI